MAETINFESTTTGEWVEVTSTFTVSINYTCQNTGRNIVEFFETSTTPPNSANGFRINSNEVATIKRTDKLFVRSSSKIELTIEVQ